jgi:hypothetical protein
MSNHTTQRDINLKHQQRADARRRAIDKQQARNLKYSIIKNTAIRAVTFDRQDMSFMSFCFFVSISFITVSYTGWLT